MFDYCVLNINDYDKTFLEENVSENRIEKSRKYRFIEDTMRSLCAEYALNVLIKKNCPDYRTPVVIFYDENGKPFIDENIEISLSHSGDFVAAMICDKTCGIDIEKDSRDLSKIAKRFFTKEEYDDTTYSMLDIWTRKESILKATGKGLILGMDTFSVLGEMCSVQDRVYKLSTIETAEGYSLSYAIEARR